MQDRIIVSVDEGLSDLIPGFLAHKRSDVGAILDATAQHDYAQVSRIAHRIKGEGGSYGFDKMTELGRSLEDAATAPRRWRDYGARAQTARLPRSRRCRVSTLRRLASNRIARRLARDGIAMLAIGLGLPTSNNRRRFLVVIACCAIVAALAAYGGERGCGNSGGSCELRGGSG